MNSKRIGALTELKRRLEQITITNGFSTDAGKNVLLGENAKLGPDDPETAIAIVVGSSTEEHLGFSKVIVSRVGLSLQAFAKAAPADGADPFLVAEDVVADIKRAAELEDRTLNGYCSNPGFSRASVTPAKRLEASEYVGAKVDYSLTFEEAWGRP